MIYCKKYKFVINTRLLVFFGAQNQAGPAIGFHTHYGGKYGTFSILCLQWK